MCSSGAQTIDHYSDMGSGYFDDENVKVYYQVFYLTDGKEIVAFGAHNELEGQHNFQIRILGWDGNCNYGVQWFQNYSR